MPATESSQSIPTTPFVRHRLSEPEIFVEVGLAPVAELPPPPPRLGRSSAALTAPPVRMPWPHKRRAAIAIVSAALASFFGAALLRGNTGAKRPAVVVAPMQPAAAQRPAAQQPAAQPAQPAQPAQQHAQHTPPAQPAQQHAQHTPPAQLAQQQVQLVPPAQLAPQQAQLAPPAQQHAQHAQPASEPAAAPPACATPAPTAVRLRVISRPAGAIVLLDGVQVGRAPLDVTLARADRSAAIKLRRNGYRSETFTVALDRNADLHVVMQPRAPR